MSASAARLTVAVHGAAGTQGAPVARRLAAAGHHVRGLGRRGAAGGMPAGVEPVRADLADVAALERAYAGADAVVIHLPGPAAPDDAALAQAEAVLEALGRAGIPRAVFNASGAIWDAPVGVPFLDARVRVAAGLPERVRTPTVLVPATRYMENLEEPWVREALARGALEQAGPAEARVAWLAIDDVARAVEDILGRTAPPASATLAGPEALDGHAAAAILGAVLGRAVAWRSVSFEEHNDHVRRHLGLRYAAGMAALYGAGSSVPPPRRPGGPHLTGATTLRAWASQRPWALRPAA